MNKPNFGNDRLLKAIDFAPRYQPIPIGLFKEKSRKKYLTWRNMQLSRPDISRDKFIDLSGKSVLDLGCEIGYFGWSNARNIKSYIGVDSNPICIEVARMITKELGHKNLRFLNVDLTEFIKRNKVHYDICLFFSIYHHLLYQIGTEKAREAINGISKTCDELYFDMGQKDEPSGYARRAWHSLLPDMPPKSFIKREVLLNTSFKHAFILGETYVGNSKRLLFKFN